MSREFVFSQRQYSRQVYWFVRYTIEALNQHTHQIEPIIFYVFRQATIIVNSVPLEEERQRSDLIEWRIDVKRMKSGIRSSFQVRSSPERALPENNRTNMRRGSTRQPKISNAGARELMGFIRFI